MDMSALGRLRAAESAAAEQICEAPFRLGDEVVTSDFTFPGGDTLQEARGKLKEAAKGVKVRLVTLRSKPRQCILVCQASNRYDCT